MKRLIYIIVSIFLVSCSRIVSHEKIVEGFGHSDVLEAETYEMSEPVFLPRYMGVSGDYLYVYKEREAYKFSVYRIPDMECLGEMGGMGQGPNDFNLLDTRSFNVVEGGFQVVEAGCNMLKTVKINEEGMTVYTSKPSLLQGVNSNGYYPLKDGSFISLGQIQSHKEFSLYDSVNDSLIHLGDYPDWYEMTTKVNPFIVYLKSCVVHPSKERFAVFYSRFKRFRIFDASMNLLHDINVRTEPFDVSLDDVAGDKPVYYVGQPYATERYIYSLCSLSHTVKHGKSELHVWDWEGNPVACYEFGRKISLFAVSEKYGKIYALDNEIENKIYIYDLPQIP